MGSQVAKAVQDLIVSAAAAGSSSFLATTLGLIFFVYAATSLFMELRDSLDSIWGVQLNPCLNSAAEWSVHGCPALAMVVATGVLLAILVFCSACIGGLFRRLAMQDGVLERSSKLLETFVLSMILFAVIFKHLPDVQIRWNDVWAGAALTAALFTLGKYLIQIYLQHSMFTSVYGAAASIAIILIWVYYTAHVLFLGMEFTQVYAQAHGRKLLRAMTLWPSK